MTTITPPPPHATRGGADGLTLRPIAPGDEEPVARIVHAAFAGIADRHGFPRDFPTPASARALVDAFVGNPGIWGVVAERGGRVSAPTSSTSARRSGASARSPSIPPRRPAASGAG
jgi:hypothetical protein